MKRTLMLLLLFSNATFGADLHLDLPASDWRSYPAPVNPTMPSGAAIFVVMPVANSNHNINLYTRFTDFGYWSAAVHPSVWLFQIHYSVK